MSHRCDSNILPDPVGGPRGSGRRREQKAFTIVEALIALSILALFAGSSVYGLMSFNDRASRNRNAEAARAILESKVDALLAQAIVPDATASGTDLDGDGVSDGVLTSPDIPLIVQRDTSATAVVTADLYTLVAQVGTSVGLPGAGDLVGVQYMLRYKYRGQYYYSKLTTFKSAL